LKEIRLLFFYDPLTQISSYDIPVQDLKSVREAKELEEDIPLPKFKEKFDC